MSIFEECVETFITTGPEPIYRGIAVYLSTRRSARLGDLEEPYQPMWLNVQIKSTGYEGRVALTETNYTSPAGQIFDIKCQWRELTGTTGTISKYGKYVTSATVSILLRPGERLEKKTWIQLAIGASTENETVYPEPANITLLPELPFKIIITPTSNTTANVTFKSRLGGYNGTLSWIIQCSGDAHIYFIEFRNLDGTLLENALLKEGKEVTYLCTISQTTNANWNIEAYGNRDGKWSRELYYAGNAEKFAVNSNYVNCIVIPEIPETGILVIGLLGIGLLFKKRS